MFFERNGKRKKFIQILIKQFSPPHATSTGTSNFWQFVNYKLQTKS